MSDEAQKVPATDAEVIAASEAWLAARDVVHASGIALTAAREHLRALLASRVIPEPQLGG